MPRRYNILLDCTAGANKTAVHILPTTGVRPEIYEIILGSAATPAAQAAHWTLERTTAAGSGTSRTPVNMDPADPASVCTCAVSHTVEPTYSGGSALTIPLNQQGSFNWKANPGAEIVVAQSASAGAGLKTFTSTGTAVHLGSFMWAE